MKDEPLVFKILECAVCVTKVHMPQRFPIEIILVGEVSKYTGGKNTLGQDVVGHPWHVRPVDGRVRHALERVAVGRPLKLPPESPDGQIGTTGMDHIPMQEDPVLHDIREFMPLEIPVPALQFIKTLHVWGNRIVIPQQDDKPAPRMLIQQIFKKTFSRHDGATEDPMHGPFEIEDIPIQYEDLGPPGGFMDPPEISIRSRVMTEQMQVGYGRPKCHV
jgi:hypothetical protein